MKIVVVFHDNNIYSGASRSMLGIIENWHNKGVNVIAIVPGRGELRNTIRNKGIDVVSVPFFKARVNMSHNIMRRVVSKFVGILSIICERAYVKVKLAPLIKKMDVDIVYSNTTSTVLGYYIKETLGLPHVWHIREFGRLDQNCEYIFGEDKLCEMLSNADLVIAISNAIKMYYENRVSSEINVVYNDVSECYINDYDRNWDAEKISVLSCGSLIPEKGHADVINAIAVLKKKGYNIQLLIAGKGDYYEKELIKLIDELGANEYIKLLGQVKDMKALRQSCHIGVVASKMEAFGRVTVEGMLSGLAMIGADSGGTSELISDRNTGLLYKTNDIGDLMMKIESLLKDRNLMKQLANSGFSDAKKYTIDSCSNYILGRIQDILER